MSGVGSSSNVPFTIPGPSNSNGAVGSRPGVTPGGKGVSAGRPEDAKSSASTTPAEGESAVDTKSMQSRAVANKLPADKLSERYQDFITKAKTVGKFATTADPSKVVNEVNTFYDNWIESDGKSSIPLPDEIRQALRDARSAFTDGWRKQSNSVNLKLTKAFGKKILDTHVEFDRALGAGLKSAFDAAAQHASKAWGTRLSTVLAHPELLAELDPVCKGLHQTENLNFLVAVQAANGGPRGERSALLNKIFNDFVKADAETPVNCSGSERQKVRQTLQALNEAVDSQVQDAALDAAEAAMTKVYQTVFDELNRQTPITKFLSSQLRPEYR